MIARLVRSWRDIVRVTAGLIMLLLGLLGLVLPVLQGILFLLVAGFLLAPYSPTVQRGLDWARRRYPRVFARGRLIRARLRARLGLRTHER